MRSYKRLKIWKKLRLIISEGTCIVVTFLCHTDAIFKGYWWKRGFGVLDEWCNHLLRLNSTKIILLCIKLSVKCINRSWSYDVVYRAHIIFDTCHSCTRSSMHHILETLLCLLRIGAFVKILEVKSIFSFKEKSKCHY